jgi:hypothetical protein
MNIIERIKPFFERVWSFIKEKWEHRTLHLKLTFKELR